MAIIKKIQELKRSKTKLAKCPCCLTEKYKTEILTCISIFEKTEKQKYKHYKELKLDQYTYGSFIDSNFEWACDSCLENKKAIIANPELQETPWIPHLVYIDTPLICNKCKLEFLFRKEEKKIWYESYKLSLNAQPNSCLECRRKTQKQKSENKIISEMLKKSEIEIADNELEVVVEIYTSWNKMEKVKYYQSILNKRKRIDDSR